MKKITNIIALGGIFVGAISPMSSVIADTNIKGTEQVSIGTSPGSPTTTTNLMESTSTEDFNNGIKVSPSTNAMSSTGYTYTVANGEATITDYSGPTDNVNIPDTLDGFTVVAIADYALMNQNLTGTLTIPSSVSSIGTLAFSQNSLTSVIINSSVLNNANQAFRYNQIQNVSFNATSIPNPEGLRGIFSTQTIANTAKLGSGTTLPISSLVSLSGVNIDSYTTNSTRVKVQGDNLVFDRSTSSYSFDLSTLNAIPNFYDADLNVTADYSDIVAKESTIPLNSSWKPSDNFVSAATSSGMGVLWGETVDGESITTTGTVNTTVSGIYPVTYSIGTASTTINVTVSQPVLGAPVTVNYIDTDNNKLSSSEVLKGNLGETYSSIKKDFPGYSFVEVQGPASGTFTDQPQEVTYIYSKIKTAVNVHDSTIYVGDTWAAQDNFDSAIDKDGNVVDFSQVIVDASKADTSKAGTFDVTYTYDGVTSTATVTVKDKQTAVNVHDSTIYVGDTWAAQDNFDSALDKVGNVVDFSQLTVDASQVDTNTPGTYDVTYTYDGVTSTAKVTVKAKQKPTPKPDKSTDNGRSEETQTDSKENETKKGVSNRDILPETGEASGMIFSAIGVLILSLVSIAILFKNKIKKS